MLLMGKSTISMAIFNSYVKLPEGNHCENGWPQTIYIVYIIIYHVTRCNLSMATIKNGLLEHHSKILPSSSGISRCYAWGGYPKYRGCISLIYDWLIDGYVYIYYYVYGLIWINMDWYGLIWINVVETCWDHLFFSIKLYPKCGIHIGGCGLNNHDSGWAELLRLSCHLRTHHSLQKTKHKGIWHTEVKGKHSGPKLNP